MASGDLFTDNCKHVLRTWKWWTFFPSGAVKLSHIVLFFAHAFTTHTLTSKNIHVDQRLCERVFFSRVYISGCENPHILNLTHMPESFNLRCAIGFKVDINSIYCMRIKSLHAQIKWPSDVNGLYDGARTPNVIEMKIVISECSRLLCCVAGCRRLRRPRVSWPHQYH